MNKELPIDEVLKTTQEDVITKKFEHQEFLDHIGLGNKPADDSQNIAIIGDPGAGKTTLLEKLAHIIYSKNKGLPICISLANLEDNQSIKEYLENKWLENILIYNDLLPNFELTENEIREFRKQFKPKENQKVWLLLDGLDEMKATSPVEAFKIIRKYINEGYLQKARVIITCRVNVWDVNTKHSSDFTTYKTQEFTDYQRNNFIQQWFIKEKKSLLADRLINKLNETKNQQICELVNNPLRLVLLCQIWTLDQGELPETKFQFYQRYLPYFYDWKKENLNLTNDYETQDKLHGVLGELAKNGIDSQARYRIKKRDAYKIMGKELLETADKLGWLNIVDEINKEPVYAFYHPTFQEYFAALAIDDWDLFLPINYENNPVQNKKYLIFDPKWKEVILLWIGREDISTEEKEKFIEYLVDFRDVCMDFYGLQSFFLAGTAINQFRNCSLSNDIVDYTIFLALLDKMDQKKIPEEINDKLRLGCIVSNLAEEILLTTNPILVIDGLNKSLSDLQYNYNYYYQYSTDIKKAKILGMFPSEKEKAINILSNIIDKFNNNRYEFYDIYTYILAAESLEIIDPKNPQAIYALIQIRDNPHNFGFGYSAESRLEKIDPYKYKSSLSVMLDGIDERDYKLTDSLDSVIQKISNMDIYKRVIVFVIYMLLNSKLYRLALLILQKCLDIDINKSFTLSTLSEFEGNQEAISFLINTILSQEFTELRARVIEILEEIIQYEQMPEVIRKLKDYFLENMWSMDLDEYDGLYQIMWKCAQTLTYPEFYEAWHS